MGETLRLASQFTLTKAGLVDLLKRNSRVRRNRPWNHSSDRGSCYVYVPREHYASCVQARQEILQAHVAKTWGDIRRNRG